MEGRCVRWSVLHAVKNANSSVERGTWSQSEFTVGGSKSCTELQKDSLTFSPSCRVLDMDSLCHLARVWVRMITLQRQATPTPERAKMPRLRQRSNYA
jgi:hypothetical protein